MKRTLVAVSHYGNAENNARALAEAFHAFIIAPQLVRIDELQEYDFMGFGSETYHEKNHRSLLDLVDGLLPTFVRRPSFLHQRGPYSVSCLRSTQSTG